MVIGLLPLLRKPGRMLTYGMDMTRFFLFIAKAHIWKCERGQDLIEYALMAGFVATAASAIMPGVASSINIVFSKVNSVMIVAASS